MMIVECLNYSPDKLRKTYNPRYTEYRLDSYSAWQSIDFSAFDDATILTCRGELLCTALVEQMFASRALVDLDVSDLEQYQSLVDPSRLILSTHLPGFDRDQIRSFLKHPQAAEVYKLVYEAASLEELIETSAMISDTPERKFIFNVSGKWALFQRSIFYQFNSYGCYMALDEPLFEGQPTMQEMLPLTITLANPKASLFPIIGNHKVSQSGSITIGNHLMVENHIEAAYVPIPAQDIDEAISAVMFLRRVHRIGGIAITNPFKELIGAYFHCGISPLNSIQLYPVKHDRNRYNEELDAYLYAQNTDVLALQQSLKELKIDNTASVLIYGSGSCATAFIQKLQRLGYVKLYVMGRNAEAVSKLQKKYHLQDPNRDEYDLLINASPLGQELADDLGVLPKFNALINLPLPQPISRLEEIAYENEIPLVDSYTFWELQFIHQLDCFMYPNTQNLDTNS
jgi:3-dehydroquinate dehydratase